MVQMDIDPVRQLLTVIYSGHVERDEVRQRREAIAPALEQLRPGFQVLVDLSGLDVMDFACAPELAAMMDLCRQKGVARVARVVPDPHKDIGLKVLTYFHYGRKVPVLTLDTREEALAKLAAD